MAGYVVVILPLAAYSAVLSGREGGSPGFFALARLASVSLAALSGVLLSASVTREIRGLSRYLGGLFERFHEPPPVVESKDELERAASKAKLLADRILLTMDMLRDEKEKVGAVIEQMEDGVALMNSKTEIILHNEAFTKMLDVRRGSDFTGVPIREVVRNPSLLGAIDSYAAAGNTVRREMAAGAGAHISVIITPFRQDLPQKRALLILHDITQQKKIERMRADFVANASHELKTPLTAISGFVETLVDGSVADPETAGQFLAIIQKHVERLSRLVDDLLTLSDMELGREKLEYSEMTPESVINGVEQFFLKTAQNTGISISREVAPDVGVLRADRDKLTQILLNLVDNAIKYTPRGGSVALKCRRVSVSPGTVAAFAYPSLDGNPILPETGEGWRRDFVEFCVADTGEGIPEKSLPRLMERFYRVDNARSRERGGTGLGLSIVKHILISHGGSIRIESELGRGTAISFIIPA
ncbi:MAG: PAS domain-containing protein [Nitrospinae bacterium]|nr:PAS domain-containing protein [Nitrospinota bacterium]